MCEYYGALMNMISDIDATVPMSIAFTKRAGSPDVDFLHRDGVSTNVCERSHVENLSLLVKSTPVALAWRLPAEHWCF